uniref:Uncharacterized protein n=1 Tax=Kalanchoe fedtschenkoi TaxID=63787 RepID=A0A7N0V4Z9_KALFE
MTLEKGLIFFQDIASQGVKKKSLTSRNTCMRQATRLGLAIFLLFVFIHG